MVDEELVEVGEAPYETDAEETYLLKIIILFTKKLLFKIFSIFLAFCVLLNSDQKFFCLLH